MLSEAYSSTTSSIQPLFNNSPLNACNVESLSQGKAAEAEWKKQDRWEYSFNFLTCLIVVEKGNVLDNVNFKLIKLHVRLYLHMSPKKVFTLGGKSVRNYLNFKINLNVSNSLKISKHRFCNLDLKSSC